MKDMKNIDGIHTSVETLPLPAKPNMSEREKEFREDPFLRRYLPSPCYLTSITYANKLIADVCRKLYGLQLSSARALFRLKEQPSAIPINEIMKLIDFPNDPGTRIVNQLVDKGLAIRKPNPTSRRSYLVGITHHGVMACEALREEFDNVFNTLTANLDPDVLDAFRYTREGGAKTGHYSYMKDGFIFMNVTLNTQLERVTDYNYDCPLTLTQYRVLSMLRVLDGETSFTTIRRFLYLRPNTLSAAASKLCDLGLTDRFQGTDQRTLHLKLTPEGEKMIDEIAPLIYEEALKYYLNDPKEPSLHRIQQVIKANCTVSSQVLSTNNVNVY